MSGEDRPRVRDGCPQVAIQVLKDTPKDGLGSLWVRHNKPGRQEKEKCFLPHAKPRHLWPPFSFSTHLCVLGSTAQKHKPQVPLRRQSQELLVTIVI